MQISPTLSPGKKHWAAPQIVLISQVSIEAKTRNFGHENTFVRSSAGNPSHHFLTFQGPGHTTYVPLTVTVQDFIS
ncbi:hypothetical protein BEL04_23195 [Mucilaginibacter sp. PPCGB 2223]|uniref:hypothetical protein n=1 Tax=Mucilaginibacter sp. PPCGB 2223 TaxID=1886027 RepID=UPI0008259085|nr:hypothetical protein [Mucilaginibacter sp. PPCGB 2223]OCX50675.1 hypothetical protein BEL04_23195 [Mucilaginibacter sp. PPCGB 2223]